MSGPHAPDVWPAEGFGGQSRTALAALARVVAHLQAAQTAAVDYCDLVRQQAETRVADVLDDPAYDNAIAMWSMVSDVLTKVARPTE